MSRPLPQLLLGLGALSVALVAAAALGAGAVGDLRRADDEIEVTGSYKEPVVSDLATWSISVGTQGATVQETFLALRPESERVRAWLRAAGVADSALTASTVSTEPMYRVLENGNQTGEIVGYRLSQYFEVRSRDVRAVTALSRRVDELVAAGAPVSAGSPAYLYTRLAEKRTELLARATADARQRADAIARAAGSGIGAVRSARMGVFQITPRNSVDVSDSGIYDTSSLEKDVTAVVRISFAVD